MRSSTAIACLGVFLLAACGTSTPTADDSIPSAETGPIDYADGAFVRDDGSTDPGGDESPPATDVTASGGVTSDEPNPSQPAATASTAATTTAGTTGGSASGGATTTVASNGGSTTATTTGGSTGSSSELAVNTGIVRIGDVTYPFDAETCDIDNTGFFVFGYGTSSEGDPIEVDLAGDTVDLDDDGSPDVNFDMYVVPDVEAGDSVTDLPDFFASKVETSTFSEGEDIVLSVTATTVSGSGPIEDFHGVAIPLGETLPMSFEARCG